MRWVVAWLGVLCALVTMAQASTLSPRGSAMTFCKCVCFGTNSTILPLYLPKDPAYPCLSCTRQFCLDQKLPACIGAKTIDQDLDTSDGSGGDVEAICFQRDSPKSHFLVVLFLSVTATLLVGAVLKQYIDLGAVWSQRGLRGILQELASLGQEMIGRASNARRRRPGS